MLLKFKSAGYLWENRYKAAVVLFAIGVTVLIPFSNKLSKGLILLGILAVLFAVLYRRPLLAVAGMVLVNENIFFLFDPSRVPYIWDLKQALGAVLLLASVYFIYKGRNSEMVFRKDFYVLFIWLFLSIFVAAFNNGQSLFRGAYSLLMYGCLLSYFVLSYLIKSEANLQTVKKIIILVTNIASLIYFIQYFTYKQVEFLKISFGERYGTLRIDAPWSMAVFAGILAVGMLIQANGRAKLYYALSAALQFSVILFITKGRVLTLGVIVVFMIILLLVKPSPVKVSVIILILCSCLAAYIYTASSDEPKGITKAVQETAGEISGNSGNFGVRIHAVEYFIDNLNGRWVTGNGTLDLNYNPSLILSGKPSGYFMVDVGVIGYVFQFGLVGLIICFYLIIKGLRRSYQVFRHGNGNFYLLAYFMLGLLICPTIFMFQEMYSFLYLGIAYAMLDFEYKKLKNKSKEVA